MERLPNCVKIFPWRRVSALFCAALVCTALWAEVQQGELADKIIRLHVIANSDTAQDQALKLMVRDDVLLRAEDLLSGAETPQEAAARLTDNLPVLAQTAAQSAREAGHPCAVRVELKQTWFPTRQYEGLSLPAGEYQALRVILGEGQGKNWWCVVFPSLAMPAVSEASAPAGAFSLEDSLFAEEDPRCVFRFKTLEWWGLWKGWLTGQK